jgi:hypothetical protein|tara:strand:- start:10615 stop:10836 length:222 start_codon:yes stop_codon:yes gene_type:complete
MPLDSVEAQRARLVVADAAFRWSLAVNNGEDVGAIEAAEQELQQAVQAAIAAGSWAAELVTLQRNSPLGSGLA